MVKIRYAELPAGLHVTTEDRGNCTVVYLLPGLTPGQRRAALTFARRAARMGHGPSLPPVDMAFALAADRARSAARTIIAVLRIHPMLLLPLVALVSGVIVAVMLSFVTVSIASVNYRATDPQPGATGGHPTAGTGSNSGSQPGLAGGGKPQHLTTPNPEVSEPANVGLPASAGLGSAASASDTPSSAARRHRATSGQFCITIGRLTICISS